MSPTCMGLLAGLEGILPSLTDVLLHLLNLAVLSAGLYFLLFRTVKKKIRERRENVEAIEKENERLSGEVEELRTGYDKMLEGAKEEAVRIHAEAEAQASRRGEEIVADARKRAQGIVDRARLAVEEEKVKLESEIRAEVKDLSVDIAGKILGREVDKEDNERLIEDCLAHWEKEDDR